MYLNESKTMLTIKDVFDMEDTVKENLNESYVGIVNVDFKNPVSIESTKKY